MSTAFGPRREGPAAQEGQVRTREEAEAALAALLTNAPNSTVVESTPQTLAAYAEDQFASVSPLLRDHGGVVQRAVRTWIGLASAGCGCRPMTTWIAERRVVPSMRQRANRFAALSVLIRA